MTLKPKTWIRKSTVHDLNRVVAVHLSSFPGFFLSSLGPKVLYIYYNAIQRDHQGILLVVEQQSIVQGFVAGFEREEGFYRRLLLVDGWRILLHLLPRCVRRPLLLLQMLRRTPWRARNRSVHNSGAYLSSIAVNPRCQGTGFGKSLVEAFCNEVKARGGDSVTLTTDTKGNDRTNLFYERVGFCAVRTFETAEGRQMNEYRKNL